MQHPGVQAREVQVMLQPAGGSTMSVLPQMPGMAPAALPTVDLEAAQDQRIRRRVVCISAIISVYVVINAVLSYVFDAATIQDAFEQIREVTHTKVGPTLTRWLVNAIPSIGTSITIGLLVPLCGYLGVKQNQVSLVGCFCGCNFLHCCCGMLSVVGMSFFMLGVQTMAPGIERHMETCDPMQCVPPHKENQTNEVIITDCLAAGTWEDYRPHFGNAYPMGCPKIYLRCGHERQEQEAEDASWYDSPESTRVNADNQFDDMDPPSVGAPTGPLDRYRRLRGAVAKSSLVRRLRFAWAARGDAARHANQHFSPWSKASTYHDGSREYRVGPPPRPHNVLAECAPAYISMRRFHQVRILIPKLLPQLSLFIFVRIVLSLPIIALGCFGFWWGKDLWHRLHQGYTQVSSRPHQVSLQPTHREPTGPTQGVAMAAVQPLTALVSAQPLLLHIPPVPPVARAEQSPSDDRGDTQSLLQNTASNEVAVAEVSGPAP